MKNLLSWLGRGRGQQKRALCSVITGMAALLITSDLQADPVHLYNLNGSFGDAFGGPSLSPGGPSGSGTLNPTNYTFGVNQGLSLSNALASTSTYSLLLDFSFSSLTGYRKIVDFQNRTSDIGLYNLNTTLDFFPIIAGPTGAFQPDLLARLVITRDSATNQFTGYLNGIPQLTFPDTSGLSIFSGANSIIQFFNDDAATSGEASAGLVDRIAIYNTALSAADVLALGGPSEISGPPANGVPDSGSTLAMLGGVLGVLGTWAHRLRK